MHTKSSQIIDIQVSKGFVTNRRVKNEGILLKNSSQDAVKEFIVIL